MKFVKNDLPSDMMSLEIELFFDTHIGSKKCDYKSLQEKVERVKNTPNVYAIIGGDVINNSTKASVGDVYEEPLSPMEQIKKATTLFYPIKDKILCVVSGNHERRSYKTDGIDLLHFMCAELDIADKYDYTSCLSFVRFGSIVNRGKPYVRNLKGGSNVSSGRKICYSIYVTHGDGNGGRTVGGKANGLERRGQIIDSDIVITGHTHQAISFRESSYRVDPQNNSAFLREQVFVNAGASLGYESYAELYGMKPNSVVSPVIVLSGTEKKILVRS